MFFIIYSISTSKRVDPNGDVVIDCKDIEVTGDIKIMFYDKPISKVFEISMKFLSHNVG